MSRIKAKQNLRFKEQSSLGDALELAFVCTLVWLLGDPFLSERFIYLVTGLS